MFPLFIIQDIFSLANESSDKKEEDEDDEEDLHGEVMRFNTICDRCQAPCSTNMKLTQIPHFKVGNLNLYINCYIY